MTQQASPIEPGIHEARGSADAVAAELRAGGWRVGVVDGPASRREAVTAIGAALGLPEPGALTLDTLFDALAEVATPTALVWTRWSALALRRPDHWAKVLGVLTARTVEEPAFAIVFATE